MGFCSEECFKNARNDGLVKNMSWDKMDYLNLGRIWRADPAKKDEIMSEIQKHLDTKL